MPLELESRYDAHARDIHAMGIAIVYVYETTDLDGGTPYTEEPPAEPTVPDYGGHGH